MSSENVLRISDINQVFKRIITLTGGGQVTVVSLNNTLAAGGTYREGDVRYIRFTNLDSSNSMTLILAGDSSTSIALILDPVASYIITSSTSTGVVDYADIEGVSLEDLTLIKGTTSADTIDLEIFVASAQEGRWQQQ